jgi:predicted ArsR family transcriptional regulator
VIEPEESQVSVVALGKRFFETTRGQIVVLLRRGARTVDELAAALELTDNAVRHQLSTLERDGLARQAGVRRVGEARKPSVLYELPEDAEPLFSSAYPPVLTALVSTVMDTLPRKRADELLREVGRRLARGTGGEAPGTLAHRVDAAAAILTALGGDVQVTREDGVLHIRGSGCPLSATVSRQPALCRTVQTLIAEVVGSPARQCCEHGDRPRCRFAIEIVGSAA